MSNSDSSPENNNVRSLLAKGLISAIALAGTTAIPILVQHSLQAPPVPTVNPAATVPAEPLTNSAQMGSTTAPEQIPEQAIDQGESDKQSPGKGKKKRDDD